MAGRKRKGSGVLKGAAGLPDLNRAGDAGGFNGTGKLAGGTVPN